MTGLEPVRPFEARDFKSLASAYSATSARYMQIVHIFAYLVLCLGSPFGSALKANHSLCYVQTRVALRLSAVLFLPLAARGYQSIPPHRQDEH